jgi:hypothetical protein
VGVFSDVHILPMYSPTANNSCFCTNECAGYQNIEPEMQSSSYAPLGKLYCDPPWDLTEAAIQRLKLEAPDVDLLFITGDIVGHTYAQEEEAPFNATMYEILK